MDRDNFIKNQWALNLCDFWTYTESNGVNPCCPYMFPRAILGTCFTVGKIRTLLSEEPVTCCEMGSQGLFCCILSTPIKLCGPAGGCIWFIFNAIETREEVKRKYGINEASSIGCCTGSSCRKLFICFLDRRLIIVCCLF